MCVCVCVCPFFGVGYSLFGGFTGEPKGTPTVVLGVQIQKATSHPHSPKQIFGDLEIDERMRRGFCL